MTKSTVMGVLDNSRRPSVFVVGDAKCGTASFYRLMQMTRDIGTSKPHKELHFFSSPELLENISGPGDHIIPKTILSNQSNYLAAFSHVNNQVQHVLDISTSYLRNRAAAARIKTFAPDAHIVVILRNPVEKVFSQYMHLWREGRELLPFDVAFEMSMERRTNRYSGMFDYEGGGWYHDFIAHYIDVFGKDRVLPLIFEQFFADAGDERARLEQFLGISLPTAPMPWLNTGGRIQSLSVKLLITNSLIRRAAKQTLPLRWRTRLRRNLFNSLPIERPQLSSAMRLELSKRYAPDIARLERLIGRRIGWGTTLPSERERLVTVQR